MVWTVWAYVCFWLFHCVLDQIILLWLIIIFLWWFPLTGENPAELYHNDGSQLFSLSKQLAASFHNPHQHHRLYQEQVLLVTFSSLLTSLSYFLFPCFTPLSPSAWPLFPPRTYSAMVDSGRRFLVIIVTTLFLSAIQQPIIYWIIKGKVSRAWPFSSSRMSTEIPFV